MPSTPRRHHTVPKSYLAGFSWKNGKLCIYDREKREYRNGNDPSQLTTVRDFYAVPKEDWTLDYALEKAIGDEIEWPFMSSLKKLENWLPLSEDEFDRIVNAAAFQNFRTTRAVDDLSYTSWKLAKWMAMANFWDPERVRSILEDMRAQWNEIDANPDEIADFVSSGEFEVISDRGSSLASAMKLYVDMHHMFHRFERHILRALWTASFITSDHPTMVWAPPENCFTFGSPWLMTPGMEFTMPLTEELCLLLTWPRVSNRSYTIPIHASEVRIVNARSVGRSDRYVIWSSEALVRSVVERSGIGNVPRGPISRISTPFERAAARKANSADAVQSTTSSSS